MGYNVHITRNEKWFEQDSPGISLDEWFASSLKCDRRLTSRPSGSNPGGFGPLS